MYGEDETFLEYAGSTTVGVGLETTVRVYTNDFAITPGAVLTVVSEQPEILKVAPPTFHSHSSIELPLTSITYFSLHGLQIGRARLVISAEGAEPVTQWIEVRQAAVALRPERTSIPESQLFPVPIEVIIGVVSADGAIIEQQQPLRAGGGNQEFMVRSAKPDVGDLFGSGVSGNSVPVSILEGDSTTNPRLGPKRPQLYLRPLSVGFATVEVSHPEYAVVARSETEIMVGRPQRLPLVSSLSNDAAFVQSISRRSFNFPDSVPDAFPITLRSLNPEVFLLSREPHLEPESSITWTVSRNDRSAEFYVHGLTKGTGTIQAEVLEETFTHALAILPQSLRFNWLPPQLDVTEEHSFSLSINELPLPEFAVTVTVDDPSVAALKTEEGLVSSVTTTLPLTELFELIGVGEGTATISVSSPHSASVSHTLAILPVEAPRIEVSTTSLRVGQHLETRLSGFIQGRVPSGSKIQMRSLNPDHYELEHQPNDGCHDGNQHLADGGRTSIHRLDEWNQSGLCRSGNLCFRCAQYPSLQSDRECGSC